MIIAPLYIILGRKKYALNLNTYRNLHFQISNKLKIRFKEIITPQLQWEYSNIWIEYTLYYARKSDLWNRVSIIDKFFLDALKENKCIIDDNVEIVKEMRAIVWGKDLKNPRMEINIYKL